MSYFLLSPSTGIMCGCLIADVSPAVTTPILINLKDSFPSVPYVTSLTSSLLAASNLNSVVAIQVFFTVFSFTFHSKPANVGFVIGQTLVNVIGGTLIGFLIGRFVGSTLPRNPSLSGPLLFTLGVSIMVGLKAFDFAGAGALATLSAAVGVSNPSASMVRNRGREYAKVSKDLGNFFSLVWNNGLEASLFVLLGSSFNYRTMTARTLIVGAGIVAVGVVARFAATYGTSVMGGWNRRNSLFISFCWLPKATVQAALSTVVLEHISSPSWVAYEREGHPEYTEQDLEDYLQVWLYRANELLNVAVVSILLTAPLGAWGLAKLVEILIVPGATKDQGKLQDLVLVETMDNIELEAQRLCNLKSATWAYTPTKKLEMEGILEMMSPISSTASSGTEESEKGGVLKPV